MSILHHKEPAEEGARISEPSNFLVNRAEFEDRMSKANQEAREIAAVVQSHITALRGRIALASEEAHLGHLGITASYLQIARRDLDAALEVLPKL